MPETFDPYLKWLGIHAADRPPNHYQLLGLKPFESDPEVISNLADRQMAHVRTFATGRHSAISQQLLNELASARICLLNSGKKRAYDAELRARLAPIVATTQAPSADPATQIGGLPGFEPQRGAHDLVAPLDSIGVRKRSLPKRRQSPAVTLAMVLMVLIALAAVLVALNISKSTPGQRPTVASGEASQPASSPSTPAGSGKLIERKQPAAKPVATPTRPRKLDGGNNANGKRPTRPNPVGPDKRINDPADDRAPTIFLPNEAASPSKPPQEEQAKVERLPVPSKAELAPARKLIGDLFGDEIEAAKTASAKATLAAKLVEQAAQTKDDPLARYRLLELAHQLAIEGESWPSARRAIEQIASHYEIEEIKLKVASLVELSKVVSSQEDRTLIVGAALDGIQRTVAADDYESAKKLARTAANVANKTNDKNLEATVKGTFDWVTRCDRELKSYLLDRDLLKKNPDDPTTLTSVGSFECLIKGDWESGLPRLAKGNDAPLAELATADLTNPSETAARIQLADRWWDLAAKFNGPANGLFKSQAFGRAEYWYRLALPQTEGIGKTRLEKRLTEIAKYAPRPLPTANSAAK